MLDRCSSIQQVFMCRLQAECIPLPTISKDKYEKVFKVMILGNFSTPRWNDIIKQIFELKTSIKFSMKARKLQWLGLSIMIFPIRNLRNIRAKYLLLRWLRTLIFPAKIHPHPRLSLVLFSANLICRKRNQRSLYLTIWQEIN